jgi:hypothetical protein
MILRDLGMGRRNIPHTHALQFCGRGLYGALRLTHVLSELQQWRQGLRSEVMRSGSAPAELGRLHTHLILNQVPYRQRMTSEHNRWMTTRKSSPYEQNGAERRGEGEGKPRRETYPRDSFGQEPEKGMYARASAGCSEANILTGKLLTTPSRLLKLLIPLPTDNPSGKSWKVSGKA